MGSTDHVGADKLWVLKDGTTTEGTFKQTNDSHTETRTNFDQSHIILFLGGITWSIGSILLNNLQVIPISKCFAIGANHSEACGY
jgi:hypothetical protein